MTTSLQSQSEAKRISFVPMTTRVLQRKCDCGQHTIAGNECSSCSKKTQGRLQRSAINYEPVKNDKQAPSIVHEVLRSPGQPLDAATRTFFEPRFGHDFSRVRIHTDPRAAQSALAVNARAYAVGHNVVFGVAYAPGSNEGRNLLAHELTHVVQQASGNFSGGELAIGDADSVHEQEAEQTAARVNSSSPVYLRSRASGLAVQRVAPAVAAIGAVAGRCIVGAIVGALIDLAIQAGMHMWHQGEASLEGMRVDYCSLILSAILGCIGGAVAAKWLEPWINSALGARLGGITGTLIGRVLLFIANKLAIGIPRAMVKKLANWHCISDDQADALAPGVVQELVASRSGETRSTAGATRETSA